MFIQTSAERILRVAHELGNPLGRRARTRDRLARESAGREIKDQPIESPVRPFSPSIGETGGFRYTSDERAGTRVRASTFLPSPGMISDSDHRSNHLSRGGLVERSSGSAGPPVRISDSRRLGCSECRTDPSLVRRSLIVESRGDNGSSTVAEDRFCRQQANIMSLIKGQNLSVIVETSRRNAYRILT